MLMGQPLELGGLSGNATGSCNSSRCSHAFLPYKCDPAALLGGLQAGCVQKRRRAVRGFRQLTLDWQAAKVSPFYMCRFWVRASLTCLSHHNTAE